ncbi:hypothetical protein BDR04DRAFT_1097792 [Suillus decipiens]|nr:hypothetical protein BDR04DRAFT_1097792 [Suillus decipiens]
MKTEDTSFKTVFLINLVLKETDLTIALSAEDYVTYLRAVLATHGKTEYKVTGKKDLWIQVHLPCIKAVSPAFPVKPISSPRSQKDAIDPCTISWVTIGRIDHRVPRTKGLD